MRARRGLASAIVALLSVSTPGAQQQILPQFHGGTDVVAVDFYAVDKDGHPVLGLTPDELTLKVGKEQRAIRSLEFLRVAPGEDVEMPVSAAARTPIAYGSNLPQDTGRMVFILFEAMSPDDALSVKAAIPGFLDQLSPHDRVGLVTFPYGRVEVDLTTDRARILDALAYVTNHAGGGAGGEFAKRASIEAVIDTLEGIAHLDGPKVVVIVSQFLLGQRNEPPIAWEFERVAQAATDARAHVYGLMPNHFGSAASEQAHRGNDGFLTTADGGGAGLPLGDLIAATGGEQFHVPGRATNMFTRIARESSAYYLLSFDTTANDRNGKSHQISLTSTRPGVTIEARPSFTVESAKDAAAHAPKPSPKGPVRGMLDDYSQHRDLPLQIAAYAFRGDAGTLRLTVASDVPGGATLTDASYALFTAEGKSELEWTPTADDRAASPIVTSVPAPAGPYRLRIAAADDAGRTGAADYEFTAGLTHAGAFTLSDLMLGESTGKDFVPRLSFSSERTASAYAELYGAMPSNNPPTVVVEVADDTKSVPRLSVPVKLRSTADADRWIATAAIPLDTLAPSDYVVRLVLRANGAELGHVVRTLHKSK